MTYTRQNRDVIHALIESQGESLRNTSHTVLSGCEVTVNTGDLGSGNNTLSVASGKVLLGGRGAVSVASQSVSLPAANSSYPRWDLVVVDESTQAVEVRSGEPTKPKRGGGRLRARNVRPPDLAAQDATPLALVWVPAGANSIDSNAPSEDIFDVRPLQPIPRVDTHSLSNAIEFEIGEPADIGSALNDRISAWKATGAGEGGLVYVPQKDDYHFLSTQVDIHGGAHIRAPNIEAAHIRADSTYTGTAMFSYAPSTTEYFPALSRLRIDGNAGNGAVTKGFVSDDTNGAPNDFHMEKVFLNNFDEEAVILEHNWGYRFNNVLVEGSGLNAPSGAAMQVKGAQGYFANMFIAGNDAVVGLAINDAAQRNLFNNIHLLNSPDRGLRIRGTDNVFTGVMARSNDGQQIEIPPVGARNVISGGWLDGVSGSGKGVNVRGDNNVISGLYCRGHTSADIDLQGNNNVVSGCRLNGELWVRGNENVITGTTYGGIYLTGARNVINGRVVSPETIDMGGVSGTVTPTALPVETLPVRVDGDSATAGAAVSLDGIDGVARNGQTVKLIHVGDDTITLTHNAAVTNPLINPGGTNDTLDAGMAVYEYDGDSGHWLQTALNTAA